MVVQALAQAWKAWADLGSTLDERQWEHPTRLDGWNVRQVYAHYADLPMYAAEALKSEEPNEPPSFSNAAELLAFMQQRGGVADTGAAKIQQEAINRAAERTTQDMVDQFTTSAPQVIAIMREADLSRRVKYGDQAVMEFAEGVRIFIMEAVVHYLDIVTALDLPRPGPMAGEPLEATVRLLTALPDPVKLIDVATGREDSTIFPVLR